MARNANTTPATSVAALSTAELMAAWLGAVDGVELSTAAIAARIVKDLSLTKDEVSYLYPAPKGDGLKDNRRVSCFDFVYRGVQENIVIEGTRILPATVAALRDANIKGETVLQGYPKTVSNKTSWKGQIRVRIITLQKAIMRHLEAEAEKTTTVSAKKSHAEFMRERMQAMFNRVNKAEDFDLADVATFNAWMESGAKMLGVKIAKAK